MGTPNLPRSESSDKPDEWVVAAASNVPPENPTSPDHRDLVIEMFADDEAAQRAYIAELERDVVSYRELARAALSALHDAARCGGRSRETILRLVKACREARATICDLRQRLAETQRSDAA